MAYQPWTPRPFALALVSLVATTLTCQIALLAAAAEDFQHAVRAGASSWTFFGSVLNDLVFAPVLAAILGFIGAFAFLGASFFVVRDAPGRRTYVWAGALSGLAHSLCGFALSLVEVRSGAAGWSDALAQIAVWGGFFLTNSPRPVIVFAAFPASIIAGAVAGFFYARITRPDAR